MYSDLPRKQKRFVDRYVLHWNGARAAREAGYSERTAKDIACELLKKPDILAAINERIAHYASEDIALRNRTLHEYAKIAFFNSQDLFNSDGTPKAIENLDPDVAAVIAGIEFEDVYEGRGESREYVGKVRKYKLVDKKGVLDSLARYLGMFNDNLRLITPPGQPPMATGMNIDISKLSNATLKELIEAQRASAP